MTQSEINSIEQKLEIKLPNYYIQTMVDYPFDSDSFAADFSLCTDVDSIIDNCSVFRPEEKIFAVGHDGGEFIYYIKLNGEDKVYINDMERSDVHNSVLAENWGDYLNHIRMEEEEIKQDQLLMEEKKRNKKWWQFWI